MEASSISNLASYRGRHRARALAAWREAADLVSLRWDGFLQSEQPLRALAFRSYLAALDAEEAAAAEMSRLVTRTTRFRTAA